jgi:hypothetical protein
MVPHQGDGVASIDHAPNGLERASDLRPPINVVAEKDRGPIAVPGDPVEPLVTEPFQQSIELGCVSVQISDEIKSASGACGVGRVRSAVIR